MNTVKSGKFWIGAAVAVAALIALNYVRARSASKAS